MELADSFFERAIVARVPVLIKAIEPDVSGRRIVEVEASTEEMDLDGDIILQSALMGSANSFVETGHLDLDHLSEFGKRMGIPDPTSYILGVPLAVEAREGGRTFVKGEISRSHDGKVDPQKNRYDEFWASLCRDPPVVWFASIYGFPGADLVDCRTTACAAKASRYLIRSIDWRSLAFTRTPKNTALTSAATIVSAKSYMTELAKSFASEYHGDPDEPPVVELPGTMLDVWKSRGCVKCGVQAYPSLLGYRAHFAKCLGYSAGAADICAHAVMHKHALAARVPALANA
jgi:hypothetical protein